MLKLADTLLILINPSPSNVKQTSDFQQKKNWLKKWIFIWCWVKFGSRFSFPILIIFKKEDIFSPTRSNKIRYAHSASIRKWMSQVTLIFFKNFEWESGVSLGELDPIKQQQSNRSCKQSDHDCTKAQIIKQIKCF